MDLYRWNKYNVIEMRVDFISTFYGANLGGAEISISLLKQGLEKRKIKIRVITLQDIKENNVISVKRKIPTKILLVGNSILDKYLAKKLEEIWMKEKPDLVHAQDLYGLPATMQTAIKLSIPVIVTVRDPLPKKLSQNRGIVSDTVGKIMLNSRNKIWICNLTKANKIIAISYFVKESLQKVYISPEKITVIFNLPPTWKILRRVPKNIADDKIILFAPARLYEEKGIHILLDALKQIIELGNEDITLIIAGDGPYRKELEKLCDNLDIRKYVKFVGKVSYDEIRELYSSCDIVVSPSIYNEPFGRVALEAMHSGKPVIASKIGGIPDVVQDNISGILVSPKNSKELANAIRRLISNEELRKSMGNNGQTIICHKFNPEKIINQHIELYEATLNESNKVL